MCEKEDDRSGRALAWQLHPSNVQDPATWDEMKAVAAGAAIIFDVVGTATAGRGGKTAEARVGTAVDIGMKAIYPMASEVVFRIVLLREDVLKHRAFVWVQIECYLCIRTKEKGRDYLKWRPEGEPRWHVLDNIKTGFALPGDVSHVVDERREEVINEAIPAKIAEVCGASE